MGPHTAITSRQSLLAQIPKGRTCRGVSRAVIEYLLGLADDFAGKFLLDIPCGDGGFMRALKLFFPKATVRGGDLRQPKVCSPGEFTQVDASHPFAVFPEIKFDVVTSVSGVMEFDNTLQFFESCREHLRDGGLFIVTNDNVVAVRDRLAYLFFGKVRQYRLFVGQRQPTWKLIPIHNMTRSLLDAGFEIVMVKYLSMQFKDWLMLPLALAIYPFQFLRICLDRTRIPLNERRKMYPFVSLLCRHYMIVCRKVAPQVS